MLVLHRLIWYGDLSCFLKEIEMQEWLMENGHITIDLLVAFTDAVKATRSRKHIPHVMVVAV